MERDAREPVAAVAVVEAPADGPAVLLIRRPVRADDRWSGQWAFPGGRRQTGDADLLATCHREAREECGLDLAAADAIALPPMLAGLGSASPLLVAPFLVRLPRVPTLTLLAAEVDAVRWLPLAEFRDPARHRRGVIADAGAQPHLPLDDVPLWGFTYRVLSAWLGSMSA